MGKPDAPSDTIVDLSFSELRGAIRARSLSSEELVRASIDRAHESEHLRAWAYLDVDGAIQNARQLDDEARTGNFRGPLHGMPIGFKDSIAVAGMPFEMGSDSYKGRVASVDSAIAQQLRAAGGVPLGINVMHALGMGNAVRHGHRATSRHPWNDHYVPGGSSCGSAVAVSSRSCVIAIGGDTGGSVRGPASSCGVIGFKPTWRGLDSRGTGHFAWSMDTLGVFGRGLDAVAEAFRAGSGGDGGLTPINRPIRIGYLSPGSYEQPSPEVAAVMADVQRAIRSSELDLDEVGTVDLDEATDIWQSRLAEMHAAFAAEEAVTPERTPENLLDMIRHSGTISTEDYLRSWTRGISLGEAFDASLENVDAILLPATPERTLTWDRWERSGEPGSDVTSWYRYLIPSNVTGHPAVTVPWTLLDGSVPSSFQLIGRRGEDERLLEIAAAVSSLGNWEDLCPGEVRANNS